MIDTVQLLKKTKPEIVAALLAEIDSLDQRRQTQVKNQVATIGRLMKGASAQNEIALLQERLAETESKLEAAQMELSALRGETTSAYDLGVSKGV